MKHQEQRTEETLMKPKHILKYKNVLSFKTTPQSSVSSSAGRNHWHPWMSFFSLVFGAASSTGCIEVCKKCSWGTYLSATGLRESHNPREISERWMAMKAGTLATVSSIIHPESPACAAQSLSICHTEYKQLLHIQTWMYPHENTYVTCVDAQSTSTQSSIIHDQQKSQTCSQN